MQRRVRQRHRLRSPSGSRLMNTGFSQSTCILIRRAGEPFENLATRDGTAVVERCARHPGGLDAVVANAGLPARRLIEEFPDERWDSLLAVPLTSPFLLVHIGSALVSRHGRSRRRASVHGLVAWPYKRQYGCEARPTRLSSRCAGARRCGTQHCVSVAPGYVRRRGSADRGAARATGRAGARARGRCSRRRRSRDCSSWTRG